MTGVPIMIINPNTKRTQGKTVQYDNINAARHVSDVIRTCLGPQAMLKMLMDPTGGIVMTNDGNAILREISVEHPAAKQMIEIARTQDEEVGDGTTTVVILAGELLYRSRACLDAQIHPTRIIASYREALEGLLDHMKTSNLSVKIDPSKEEEMLKILKSCLGTKCANQWSDLCCRMALDAVLHVSAWVGEGDSARRVIDIKRYAKVEKLPGASVEDSEVVSGVVLNKDVTHPQMKRRIVNPRILLIDSGLEYKKGESVTSLEMMRENDMKRALELEEESVRAMVEGVIGTGVDLLVCSKGVSDTAQFFLQRAGISALRRLRNTDMARLARVCGAKIVSDPTQATEDDVGKSAGLFEVKLVGDEYFSFITANADAKKVNSETGGACTLLLRGPSKDLLKEVERNLHDAMNVARNIMLDQRLVPGGGATEMALSTWLSSRAEELTSSDQQIAYQALATALKVIPKTLIQNCGRSVLATITDMGDKHKKVESGDSSGCFFGVDGDTGEIVDERVFGIWDPLSVKTQVLKTAVETAIALLRIDDIVAGMKKNKKDSE